MSKILVLFYFCLQFFEYYFYYIRNLKHILINLAIKKETGF